MAPRSGEVLGRPGRVGARSSGCDSPVPGPIVRRREIVMRNFLPNVADYLPGRARARRTTAAVGGLLLGALVAAGQALASPLSGLAWPSGAKDGLDCLAQIRGRAIDVTHVHVLGPDFPGLV